MTEKLFALKHETKAEAKAART